MAAWRGVNWARWLLLAALGVLVAGGIFSAAASLIWLGHWPSWASRVSAGGYLAGVVLAAGGVAVWLVRGRAPFGG